MLRNVSKEYAEIAMDCVNAMDRADKCQRELEKIRELHAREPEIERLYLDSKILPGELQALVMVSNCLEREFIHRQLATGQPLHMNVL